MKVIDENGLRTLWGRVTAAIEGLSDTLVAAINGKADDEHTHSIREIADLEFTLNNKAYVGHTHSYVDLTEVPIYPDISSIPCDLRLTANGNTVYVALLGAGGSVIGHERSVTIEVAQQAQATAPVSASLDSSLSYVVPGTETGTVAITAIFTVVNTSGAALTEAQAHSFSAMLLPDTGNVWAGATQDLPEALTGLAAGASTTVTYKLTTAGTSTDIGFGYRLLYHSDDGASVTVCQGVWPDVAPA